MDGVAAYVITGAATWVIGAPSVTEDTGGAAIVMVPPIVTVPPEIGSVATWGSMAGGAE